MAKSQLCIHCYVPCVRCQREDNQEGFQLRGSLDGCYPTVRQVLLCPFYI